MGRVILATAALALVGCGNSDGPNDAAVGDDMAVAIDLATARDLSALPPDFGFGTNSDGAVACVAPAGGTRAQYVWNGLMMPMQRADYAWDLNGDGRVDNQLGNINAALAGQGLNVQQAADDAVTSGRSITLLDERSTDPGFMSDACAASDVYAGVATTSPDFSGHGHFTVDGSAEVGAFTGLLRSARFTSEPPPAAAQVPVTVRVPIALFSVVPVDLVGARLSYVRAADGTIHGGQVNGAIRQHDIETKLVPNIAAALNAQVQANPSSSTTMQILQIFDTGGAASPACGATCQNLDGSCAKANDRIISDCEVGTNGIIRNLLAPDVQLFDAAGNYHPNPANTNKDSLSIGIGFTAVPATF